MGLHKRLALKREAERMLRALGCVEEEAHLIEECISALDDETKRALNEDLDRDPLTRRIAYRVTKWAINGWFASAWDTPISIISDTAEELNTDNHEYAENLILDYFNENIDLLMSRILNSCPKRASIIKDAYNAHREGLYSLSIPTMLIQADGIACQYFDVSSIYSVSQKQHLKIKEQLEKNDSFLPLNYHRFLITSLNSLNASFSKRKNFKEPLNRHQIIHGEYTNYPSLKNSLKSISWLNYIVEITNE